MGFFPRLLTMLNAFYTFEKITFGNKFQGIPRACDPLYFQGPFLKTQR